MDGRITKEDIIRFNKKNNSKNLSVIEWLFLIIMFLAIVCWPVTLFIIMDYLFPSLNLHSLLC